MVDRVTRKTKCTACGSDEGYFADAHWTSVIPHNWDGTLKYNPLAKGNAVYTEQNFRCASCKFPATRQRTIKE